jgi:lysozyme family protein
VYRHDLEMKILVCIFLTIAPCFAASKPAGHDSINARRWEMATIPAHRRHEAQVIVDRINRNQARYEAVAAKTGVPWGVIAALHNMEASGDFAKHLHEGSSLKYRTKDVPKGRPLPPAQPPFTWEFSAIDALVYDRMGAKNWNDIGPALSAAEGYNGWGYAMYHPSTPSPYLWAGTTAERPGKYVADGKWSPTARSGQTGVATLWKLMWDFR